MKYLKDKTQNMQVNMADDWWWPVTCFWLANHSSLYAKENFQEQNSFYLWKLTFRS